MIAFKAALLYPKAPSQNRFFQSILSITCIPLALMVVWYQDLLVSSAGVAC
jgi:hypothetical protein